jgi:glycosyltransferase involved in cell wall biosynthesis
MNEPVIAPTLPATTTIKILYVIGTMNVGGAENHIVQLCSRLDRSRFTPTVCCLFDGGPLLQELEKAKVDVLVLGSRKNKRVFRTRLGLLIGLWRLIWYMRKHRFSIVHAHLYHAYILAGLCAKLADDPVLITSRHSMTFFKKQLVFRVFEGVVNRYSDLVIAVSKAIKKDVLEQERLQTSKIKVVYNGIDMEKYGIHIDTAEKKRSLGLDPNARAVGVIANLHEYKGHRSLIEAAHLVTKSFPAVQFVLVGDGPMRPEIEAMIASLGLSRHVFLLGRREDVSGILASVDVYVHPSFQEGFSYAILEAMAAGKPVIAAAVGGNPEAVVHGETGFLVPPGNTHQLAEAILWLVNRPTEAFQLGAAGRRRVAERFEISAMVREYESLYERLVAAKRPDAVATL